MRYLGGKSRIRKQVAGYLESIREGRKYWEPFVGGGWVMQEMSGVRCASDVNRPLITMYKALQDGWIPPSTVTAEMYAEYKGIQDAEDPLTAFIGIGCSFSGKWFGGYARSGDRNYALNAKNSLIKQIPLIQDVVFYHSEYVENAPEGVLIYCDPPYANTTEYRDSFDTETFWEVMREWSKDNIVVVSEYNAPDDWVCVKEMPTRVDMQCGEKNRVEKLFTLTGY